MAATTSKPSAAEEARAAARRELLKWIVRNEAIRRQQRKANEK